MSASKFAFPDNLKILKKLFFFKFLFSRCDDGRVTNCLADSANALRSDTEHSNNIMSILAIILAVAILVLALFGGGLYFLK